MTRFARRLILTTFALTFAVCAQSADTYVRVGQTTDIKCPARLKLEEGFVANPEFSLTPDEALAASKVRCPSKLAVTVFADSKNYYITTFGSKPGTVGTHVVNGKTGKVSFWEPKEI
jgi:hypothetical protein